MKTIEELLKNLARPEVLEFGLVTNRLPSVNIGGKFEPVDDEAPSTERLMQMLVTMGGSRYVDSLSDKPVQWTTRLDGVGVIAVAAIMRKEVVQARFTVAKREPATTAPARSPAATTQPSAARPSDKIPTGEADARARPAAASNTRLQVQRTGAESAPSQAVAAKSSAQTRAAPVASPSSTERAAAKGAAQPQPQALKSSGSGASSAALRAAVPAAGPAAAPVPTAPQPVPPPPEDEWDDDDEPTLQTLSPPVAPPLGGGPKPARRPDEVSRPDAEEARAAAEHVVAMERAAAEKAAAEKAEAEKAAQARAAEKAAAEKAAAQKAAQERAAAEKAAQERAATEKAAQERAAAAEKAAAEKAAAEKAAAEKAAAEKAAAEKAAAEKAAAEKAAAEKAAAEKAAAEKAAAEKAAAEKAAAEKAAAEKAAAEKSARERAAAEKAEQERAERVAQAARERAAQQARVAQETPRPKPSGGMGRRISTPTSVDAVDVEITTTDAGSKPRPVAIDVDDDSDVDDNTVSAEVQSTGSAPSVSTATGPIPEKDRPRVDAGTTLDAFLAMAVSARASDLHIVAGRPILLRVASDLLPRTQAVPTEHVDRIAKEIVPARLRDTFERDGACEFAVEHPTYGRFRVNVTRQRNGFKLNLRVVPRELPTLASLGLPESLGNSVRGQRGLVLVTGAVSQGKSTTIAALVDQVNRETARHIVTIEDPIEHLHPRKKGFVSQREVGLHTRSTKARAIQTALREDPDVIVVTDLRDVDAVRLALEACESGRLVIAGMNMPTAAQTVDRILDLFPPSEEPWARTTLASSLKVILGQRLVPSADRTRLHVAAELLPWSVALHGLIRDGRTHQLPQLQQNGKAFGVVRLDDSLAELVRTQKATLEVAKQVAELPSELDALVARAVRR